MSMTTDLAAWIGRSETVHDVVDATPVVALTATLDHPPVDAAEGTPLPPLWHWLYFLPMHRQSEVGADGHAKRGGFLPPVPLPRRMWAGSQFDFRTPIRIGDRIARTSTIEDVTTKDGRTGRLVFVRVRHEVRCNDDADPALVEHHDIVYREAQPAGRRRTAATARSGRVPRWQRRIVGDPVLLFRYSALTFNGHRIHYDRSYVTEVEGYPGLVVHGPLIATLLLDLLRRERPEAERRDVSLQGGPPDLRPASVPRQRCAVGRRQIGPSVGQRPRGLADDGRDGDAALRRAMQPLKGITVVTLEHAIAAPFATRQLADLGARVIKIERPGTGDFARGYDERVRGLASHFVWTNRSKESLTLDMKHPEAARILQRLVSRRPTCWCRTWRRARRPGSAWGTRRFRPSSRR